MATISAIFETPDMADLAMLRLRRESIPIISNDINGLDRQISDPHLTAIAYPTSAGASMTSDERYGSNGSIGHFGGALYFSNEMRSFNQMGARGSDTRSVEVRMDITVPDHDARRAVGILVSCHGRQARIVS